MRLFILVFYALKELQKYVMKVNVSRETCRDYTNMIR
jgi:hypothetical protein